MTDQNTQSDQDQQDTINAMLQDSKDMNVELDKIHSDIKTKIKAIDEEASGISKDLDIAKVELDEAEKEAGDELDQLMIEEADELAAEDEEDAVEED